MAWRLHLTNQAIQRLDILNKRLAVWTKRDRITYYDLKNGVLLEEQTIEPARSEDRTSDIWQTFISELKTPDGHYLPTLTLNRFILHLSEDGGLRLYQSEGLKLENEGQEYTLDVPNVAAVALDRFLGLIAVIDGESQLNIFQQQIKVGTFDLPFQQTEYLRPMVTVSHGGTSIFVSDGQQIALMDSSGTVKRKLNTYYDIRQMACSPDGKYLVTSDMDSGVIRVYNGEDLTPTHQRFAIDLVAEATQVQLMADMPPIFVALSALTIDNDANIAFSMSGVVCVTELSSFDELPRPQTLL